MYYIQRLTVKGYRRSRCTFIMKTLELSRRKCPVQTILNLFVESGLVYLGIQVSYFGNMLANVPARDHEVLTFLTDHVPVFQCAQQQQSSIQFRIEWI